MAKLLTKTGNNFAFERNFTDKYCYRCGQERVEAKPNEVSSTNFDSKTGNKTILKVCNNLKCELGCIANGGHIYEKFAVLFFYSGRQCVNCGHVNPQYQR